MDKIRLTIGTVNHLETGRSEEELEEIYQSSYKPFISFLHSHTSLKAVVYYSGLLIEWFSEKHPEFILLLKELAGQNRIELLSSGYYEPVFNMIPPKDRRSQIEMMSNEIRKRFKKRSSGGWIANGIWEPSLTSTVANSGLKYLFLPENNLLKSGIPAEQLYESYLTEDQGKTLTLFPIHQHLVNLMGIKSPDELVRSMASIYTQSDNEKYVNLLMNGNLLGKKHSELSDIFTGDWLTQFYEKCIENRDLFDNNLPRYFFKNMGVRRKIYLQCDQGEDFCGSMLNLDQAVTLNLLKRHLQEDGMVHFVQCGYYRQFLTRYSEADRIYHKQNLLNMMINQNTQDKARKKAARESLFRAQRGDVYSHGTSAGIYDNRLRKEIYNDLLEAERMTREKGVFRQNIIQYDYNLDGVDEILYSGQNYNVYLSREGGEAIELDYLPARWNYLDTMRRYREMYHIDSTVKSFDEKPANLFSDFFFRKDFAISSLDSTNLPDCSHFDTDLYEISMIDREKRIVRFKMDGSVLANGKSADITFIKEYRFKKGIELNFEIINHSNDNLNLQFASLMNLAFAQDNGDVQFVKEKNGRLVNMNEDCKDAKLIEGFSIHDKHNSTQIDFQSSRTFSLYKESIYTSVMDNGEPVDIFQHYALLPLWNVSIRPNTSWKLKINLNIAKKQN